MPGMSEEPFAETLAFWHQVREHASTAAFDSLERKQHAHGGGSHVPLAKPFR